MTTAKQFTRSTQYRYLLLLIALLPGFFAPLIASAEELRVLTYNLLPGRNWPQRLPQFISQVESTGADVIALQEVSAAMLDQISRSPELEDYTIAVKRNPHGHPQGGLVFLSKLPTEQTTYTRLPSDMRRGLLQTTISPETCATSIRLANVHLESGLNDIGQRIDQMTRTMQLVEHYSNVIWLGDFNFGDEDEEQAYISADFIDLWSHFIPGSEGLTYNRERNPLADTNAFWFEPSRRLDRIFLKSQQALTPSRIEMIGHHSSSPASDHYGLLAVFECKQL